MGVVKNIRLSVYCHILLYNTPKKCIGRSIAFSNFQAIGAKNCIGSGNVKEKLR